MCSALLSEHCSLTELSLQDFGFTCESVLQLVEPLSRPTCQISTLLLFEWPMNPSQLLDDGGILSMGQADGQAVDAVLACALLDGKAGSEVRGIDLEQIGTRLGLAGLQAVMSLMEGGRLCSLRSLNLRNSEWLSKRQARALSSAKWRASSSH